MFCASFLPVKRKRVVVLGATGSIGESAAKVARDIPERVEIVGIAANSKARAGRASERIAARRGLYC
jgi:1-deoxy-D-xylulose 5-phosphate reductoisomerase